MDERVFYPFSRPPFPQSLKSLSVNGCEGVTRGGGVRAETEEKNWRSLSERSVNGEPRGLASTSTVGRRFQRNRLSELLSHRRETGNRGSVWQRGPVAPTFVLTITHPSQTTTSSQMPNRQNCDYLRCTNDATTLQPRHIKTSLSPTQVDHQPPP